MVLDSLKGKKKKNDNIAESCQFILQSNLAWTKKKQLKCKIYREENFKKYSLLGLQCQEDCLANFEQHLITEGLKQISLAIATHN